MAVAGLHKASGLDSYLGENHSSTSRSWCNNETRTSSIRKMWQSLESDNRAGEKGRQQMSSVLTSPESPCSSSLEGESMESEDTSIDANEIENECPPHQNQNRIVPQNRLEDVPEKERVRKIFHEWGSKSFGGHSMYSPCMNTCSRAEWVGENECKRVRLVREWIELSTQKVDICQSGSEEPVTKIGSRIESVGDGTVDCGAGARSSIRRIYGKQALLDLLTKFERERDKEVEGLLEKRLVSNFAHRHRIQSLLKGRFLRNQRFVEVGKQTSVAASELGFLRQTNAVSEIRKGFLSRLNNYEHVPEAAQSDSDTSSDNDTKYEHTEQGEEIIGEQFETTNLTCNWESINSQECSSPVAAERHDAHRDYDSDASSDNGMKYEHTEQAEEIVHDMPNGNDGEFETTNLTEDRESQNLVELASLLTVGEAHHDYDSDTSSDHDMKYVHTEVLHSMPNGNDEESETTNLTNDWESQNLLEFTSPSTVGETHESILEFEERDRLPLTVEFTETISPDLMEGNHNIYDIDLSQGTLDTAHVEELEIHEPPLHLHALQTSTNNFNWQQVSTQVDEWYEDDDDDGGGGWYQETLRSDFQESHEEWYDNLVGDTTESWMGGNSYLEAALVSRNNEYYSSGDDDNVSSRFELRELTSRRTVSNLLQSDFGARLEQLMQSYVDRQDQAFEAENGWILEQEQQQQENAGGIEDVDSTQGVLIPDFHHQHLATNWEIINGLRIDMNTLQQRMNDMQKMLEACMDMQLALQQSVHQEIYPALNRSANSRGGSEDGMWNYQSKSSPENGVCFLCCDDGFESLTHRSAHMYICSKCAQKVNWSKLKESVRQPQDEV